MKDFCFYFTVKYFYTILLLMGKPKKRMPVSLDLINCNDLSCPYLSSKDHNLFIILSSDFSPPILTIGMRKSIENSSMKSFILNQVKYNGFGTTAFQSVNLTYVE